MGANANFTFTNVRLLYPKVLKSVPKYSGIGEEFAVVALIPKSDTAQIQRFKDVYDRLVATEFKAQPGNLRPFIGQSDKSVLKDGDDKHASALPEKRPNYEPYKGHMFINLSIDASEGRIEAVDLDQNPIISAEQFPSGSYGHIVAECSAYRSPKYGPQFSIRPRLVQVTDTSEPIGAPRMSTEDALSQLPGAGGGGGEDVGSLF